MSEVESGQAPAEAPAIDTTPPPVGAAPEAPAETTPEPTIDDTLSAAWDKAQTGNEREADGKFVSTKEPELAAEPPKEAEPATAIEPPNSWTAEAKANWGKLPADVQDYVLKREADSHKAISTQGERLKSFEPFERVLTEYKDDFARHAVAPDQGIRALLEAQRMFDRDPLSAATTLLLQRGIDIRPLLAGQQGAIPQRDPIVGQLHQKVQSLEQTLQTTLKQQEEAQAAADQATVQEFAKGKPYFEDVRATMARLLESGVAETLPQAYEAACKIDPSVAKRIETDQRKAAEDKRKADETAKQEELKKKAQDAAKSAKVNVRSGTASSTSKTMDDTLAEIARRAYG